MPWKQDVSGLVTSGPGAAKAGIAGVGILLSALWEHAGSLAVALLIFLWLLDMSSGIVRAVDHEGVEGFVWGRFWSGFRKLLAAGIAIGLAIGAELLLVESGMQWAPVTIAVTSVLGFGFFWSALGNLTHFFPGLRGAVKAVVDRRTDSSSDGSE